MIAPAPTDPDRAAKLDEPAYRTLFERLGQLVGTLVLDCGTGLDDPPARAALSCADQLVLVCDDEPDTASTSPRPRTGCAGYARSSHSRSTTCAAHPRSRSQRSSARPTSPAGSPSSPATSAPRPNCTAATSHGTALRPAGECRSAKSLRCWPATGWRWISPTDRNGPCIIDSSMSSMTGLWRSPRSGHSVWCDRRDPRVWISGASRLGQRPRMGIGARLHRGRESAPTKGSLNRRKLHRGGVTRGGRRLRPCRIASYGVRP